MGGSRAIKKAYLWALYRFVEGAFFLFFALVKVLPLTAFRVLAAPFFRGIVYILVPRRRILRNLGAAFGEAYSEPTKKGLAKGVQEHFMRNLMDCLVQLRDPGYARKTIAIQGIGNLDAALARGKGVIALGAHIGNFVLAGARLGMEGYRFHSLFRVPKDRRIREILDRYAPYFYQRIIPARPRPLAIRRILSALKRNEIVFVLADNLKKGRIETMLFGQPVPSPRGPVSLALRSGAAVVPLYVIRNYQGRLELIIEPELNFVRNGNLSEDIAKSTREVVGYVENLVRKYPDQWSWLTVRMGSRGETNRAA